MALTLPLILNPTFCRHSIGDVPSPYSSSGVCLSSVRKKPSRWKGSTA